MGTSIAQGCMRIDVVHIAYIIVYSTQKSAFIRVSPTESVLNDLLHLTVRRIYILVHYTTGIIVCEHGGLLDAVLVATAYPGRRWPQEHFKWIGP